MKIAIFRSYPHLIGFKFAAFIREEAWWPESRDHVIVSKRGSSMFGWRIFAKLWNISFIYRLLGVDNSRLFCIYGIIINDDVLTASRLHTLPGTL